MAELTWLRGYPELVLERVRGLLASGELAAHLARKENDAELGVSVLPDYRGRGIGASLVDAIRSTHPGLPLLAETDHDAVAVYRALGFTVEPRPPDRRWPGRPRYRCTLAASSA